MSLPAYTICVPCGALIHDRIVHAEFHARLDGTAAATQDMLRAGFAALEVLSPGSIPPMPGGEVAPISGRGADQGDDPAHPAPDEEGATP